ncbi:hypothetical protein HDU67_001261 [Dinochytrium kinnereticum]|nr:hypothetical protein HDU67_001261 [Dinochytrium kinnereticum]
MADQDFSSHLKIFYQRLFPFDELSRWLSVFCDGKNPLSNREFSFTLESDAYIRFQSFSDGQELKQEVTKLCPVKIDIGAVYNTKPKDKKALRPGAFQPKERELVFDIDLTDYDEVRTCCSEANVCRKCWVFICVAIKVIHRVLKEDFGFMHILWVYSGRRGIHCWVSDSRAKKLSAEGRRAIVSYIDLIRGGEEASRKVNLQSKMHHKSVRLSNDTVKDYFTSNIILNQDVLSTESKWQKLLQMIPDDDLRSHLNEIWAKNPDFSAQAKWLSLVNSVRDVAGKKPDEFVFLSTPPPAILSTRLLFQQFIPLCVK